MRISSRCRKALTLSRQMSRGSRMTLAELRKMSTLWCNQSKPQTMPGPHISRLCKLCGSTTIDKTALHCSFVPYAVHCINSCFHFLEPINCNALTLPCHLHLSPTLPLPQSRLLHSRSVIYKHTQTTTSNTSTTFDHSLSVDGPLAMNASQAVPDWIAAHTYQTAFHVVNGVIICTPAAAPVRFLSAMGFSANGPVAGKSSSSPFSHAS